MGVSKKTMSVNEFKDVPILKIFENDKSLSDNYDIAKKIAKFFDGQFGDTDTGIVTFTLLCIDIMRYCLEFSVYGCRGWQTACNQLLDKGRLCEKA